MGKHQQKLEIFKVVEEKKLWVGDSGKFAFKIC